MPSSDATPIPFDAPSYVDLAAQAISLPIPPETRDGVIENFEWIWRVARPVVEFPLPDDLEAASTFEP